MSKVRGSGNSSLISLTLPILLSFLALSSIHYATELDLRGYWRLRSMLLIKLLIVCVSSLRMLTVADVVVAVAEAVVEPSKVKLIES